MRSLLFPPDATRRDWAFDIALAASVALAQIAVSLWLGETYGTRTLWGLAMCLMLCFTLGLRRHSPLLALAAASVLGLAHLVLLNHPTPALAVVPLISFAVARWVPGLASRSVLAVGFVASVAAPVRWFGTGGYIRVAEGASVLAFTFGCLCFAAVVTPYILGRRSRETDEATAQALDAARERYAAASIEREQQMRLVEGNARATIARELHDVVAHSLSIMIVQAEGGRALATKNPDAAARALDTIAEVGRESLTEMRRIVGVLRSGVSVDAEADFSPAPSLAEVPALVARTNGIADLRVTGTPRPVSPALELTAFRVVQEALTNVIKHAGPDAHAHVELRYGPTRLEVEIVDDGEGFDDEAAGGNGLVGMRERVASMGGTLWTGPLQTSAEPRGYRVYASLPARPADERGRP